MIRIKGKLVLSLLVMTIISVFLCDYELSAKEVFMEGKSITFRLTEEAIEKEHEEQFDKFCEENGITGVMKSEESTGKIKLMSEISEYKRKELKKVVKNFSGYPGDQPRDGVRFSTGGSFFYTKNGGPMCSLDVALGNPIGSVGISVSLGRRSKYQTDYSCNVSDTKHNYKLYVRKTYEFKPYVIYHKDYNERLGKNEWKVQTKGYSKVCTQIKLTPRRVK